MNVLIIGAGGREHALAASVAKSPLLKRLFIAPGNPGCETEARRLPIAINDTQGLLQACREEKIDFVIIGPEGPLVAGLVDQLTAAGIPAFGPTAAAARLEGSKGFAKDFCREFGIPTAPYCRFRDHASAWAYVQQQGAPIVVKADGLAAGKGVVVAKTLAEAEAALTALYTPNPYAECVVEAFLQGTEVSFFALCDGATAVSFGSAQDYKRAYDDDLGPNTGGMGAYSPSLWIDAQMEARIMETIILPTLNGMQYRGAPFRGILFAGLMMTAQGPQLIEYNVRFGDPETQVIIPRLREDLLFWLHAAACGTLPNTKPLFAHQYALTVVMAARDYPTGIAQGERIEGLQEAAALADVAVFHSGTRREGTMILAEGGRVLTITGMGDDLRSAQARAYAGIKTVVWPGGRFRSDIGGKL